MNEDLSKARDRFVEGIGRLAASMGVSRVNGQLYAMLFLSEEPLCLDDMVERLKISKGNASLNIRKLESLGVAKRVWVKGDRKDFYQAELDFEKIIKGELINIARSKMKIALDTVTETEDLIKKSKGNLNEEEKRIKKLYLKRLESAKEINNFVETMLNSIFSGK
jgi:DNA-binding transcriptional regulator GbsR (MarR family)